MLAERHNISLFDIFGVEPVASLVGLRVISQLMEFRDDTLFPFYYCVSFSRVSLFDISPFWLSRQFDSSKVTGHS